MFSLLKELAGIGCIGFGGGSALIPVFQERLVGQGKKLSQEELDDSIAIACITPGALPVEMAAGVGYLAHGTRGMFLGAAAMALPGVALLLLLMALLSQADYGVLDQVGFLAVGVSGYIISMLARYIRNAVNVARGPKARAISIAVVVLAFFVTCEKSLYRLLVFDSAVVVFGIGTINTMALAFFLALWIRDRRTPARIIPALVLTLLYCLCVGGFDDYFPDWLRITLIVVMAAMALLSVRGDSREHNVTVHLESPRRMLKAVVCSFAVMLIATIPAVFFCQDAIAFVTSGAVSTLLSFGGGDAYIAMADGFFVESGMLDQDTFYSLLVPVTNALPGSILCKVIAGVGYCIAIEAQESIALGLYMGALGFIVAVGMSCITFVVTHYFYEALDGLKSFAAIKRVIGCVVSGLLLTVALGLLNTCAANAPQSGWIEWSFVALCLVLAVANYLLKSRMGLHPLAAVLGSAVISCAACNLLALL